MDKDTIKHTLNSRTGVAAGIGGLLGFFLGGPPGAVVGAAVGAGAASFGGDTDASKMTAKHQVYYKRAMETIQNPNELRKLADAFEREGFKPEAIMLRKRAKLRELSPEQQEMRRGYFRKAMASDDPVTINKVADLFEEQGAIDSAKILRDHATAVHAAHLAGRTERPLNTSAQETFANKLAKAIIHFGPDSDQAKRASANLIHSRGKRPTPGMIAEVIRIASSSLPVNAPPAASATPDKPIEVDADAVTNGAPPGPFDATAAAAQPPLETTPRVEPAQVEPLADGSRPAPEEPPATAGAAPAAPAQPPVN